MKKGNIKKVNRMQVLIDETRNCLRDLRQKGVTDPSEIASEIIDHVGNMMELYNAGILNHVRRWAIPVVLEPAQLAEILMDRHTIRRVSCIDEAQDTEYDLLAVYQEDGREKGIYSTADDNISRLCYLYNQGATSGQIKEVKAKLFAVVPRVKRCKEPNLVPVNNGIFDFDTKQLLPFGPDMVFLGKCRVDYVSNAKSPVIREPDGTDWELEAWVRTLTDDPEIVNAIWEIIGACIRPNVPWNKAAWFYSERGNNGKGTLCALMRNICGPGNHTAINLADFGKDFALEPLIRTSAIINDENDVGVCLDKVANLKAIITGDTIQVNRKFKSAIAYQYRGFMVQCINGLPSAKDKSDSFYRRQLVVPFCKNFNGIEKRYIKQDYLRRREVLEYALWRVLNMDYYELSEPAACRAMLLEYKEANDPLRQFWAEFSGQFTWDLLPYKFLFDLYSAWMKESAPGEKVLGKTAFKNALNQIVLTDGGWAVRPKRGDNTQEPLTKTQGFMDAYEPLVKQYALANWMKPDYDGIDETKKFSPNLAAAYRGIIRATVAEKYADRLEAEPNTQQADMDIRPGSLPQPEPGM